MQHQSLGTSNCVFCAKDDGELHEFKTFDTDENIQYTILLARVGGGNLTAIEAKYHLSCLTALRNRHRSFLRKSQSNVDDGEQSKNEARAFMELVTHIDNSVENGIFCFTFCSLRQMYEGHLQILGIGKEIYKKNMFYVTFLMLKSKMMGKEQYWSLNKECSKC